MGDEIPAPKHLKLKKYAKRLALPAAAVIVGGLYQQGYISEEVYQTVLRLLTGLLGLGGV